MIHLFEPHGDDALISCYPILRKSSRETVVVTVGASRSSERLQEHFPGLRTHYEGVYEIPNQIGRAAYLKDYRAWKLQVGINGGSKSAWEWQRDITTDHNRELFKESYMLTYEFVENYFTDLWTTNPHGTKHLIMVPIGLLHPYHIVLADVLWHNLAQFPMLDFGFYAEAPYNSSKWVREIEESHPLVSRLVNKGRLGIISYPPTDVIRKEMIFRDVYPTEVKIFRFTRDEVLNNATKLYLPITWTHIL